MHTEMPAASASRVDYQSVVVIGKAATFTLVKVHGKRFIHTDRQKKRLFTKQYFVCLKFCLVPLKMHF